MKPGGFLSRYAWCACGQFGTALTEVAGTASKHVWVEEKRLALPRKVKLVKLFLS